MCHEKVNTDSLKNEVSRPPKDSKRTKRDWERTKKTRFSNNREAPSGCRGGVCEFEEF